MRIAYFPHCYNLGEVTTGIQIGKALVRRGHEVTFLSHGGSYESLIESEGFRIYRVYPLITPQEHSQFIRANRGEGFFNRIFSLKKIIQLVRGELKIYQDLKPDAVVSANVTASLSSRIENIPFIIPIAGTWTLPFWEYGLGTYKLDGGLPFVNFLPDRISNFLAYRFHRLKEKIMLENFNRAAKYFGLPEFKNTFEIMTGNLNLITDIPEILGVPEEYMCRYRTYRENLSSIAPLWRYVGPIFAKVDIEIPDGVKEVFSFSGPKIFCSMGSSTNLKFLKEALNVLLSGDYYSVVIIPPQMQSKIRVSFEGRENLIVCSFLPSHRVSPMADVALIHGGRGTVYTACAAGIPIVGVDMQPEQRLNLECIERAGVGIRLSKREFRRGNIISSVEKVLKDQKFRENAKRISRLFKFHKGEENAARIIEDLIKRRINCKIRRNEV